ncbi:MAG: hypothetical protein JWO43_443 [Candidatus Adlerbacteria bacterium]|nr:hypothetical protein [Candidatus Adlerbacteria bacterium]
MIHPLDKEQKVTVLLAALSERYESLRTIRERVQSIGVWALGLLLGIGGWLIQSETTLTSFQKTFYILGILAAFAVLRFKYLEDLSVGFKSQQKITTRLEKALGLFTPGIFDSDTTSIYPQKWEKAGTAEGSGNFFETTYILLYIGVFFVIVVILLSHSPSCGLFAHHFFK